MNPGQTLKDKRTAMGLSVNDVAVATKINPRILKALEEGQKENLPPRSFVRGFIRSYANYLKLNADEILQAFESEEGIAAPTPSETPAENKDVPNKSSRDDISRMEQSSRLGTIMVTGGIIVLIMLIFGVKSIMDKYAQERVVEPAQIETQAPAGEEAVATEAAAEKSEDDDDASPGQEAAAAATDAAKTDDKKPEEKKDEKVTTPAEAAKTPTPAPTAPAAAAAPVVTPTPAPVVKTPPPAPAPTLAPAVKPAEPPAEKVAEKPTEKKAEPKGSPQEIIVEALDQVELTIAIDGGGTKKITLKPDSIHTIKAQKDVVLEVSDGGLVNIIQNGNDRGNPGQLGKAAKLKYP